MNAQRFVFMDRNSDGFVTRKETVEYYITNLGAAADLIAEAWA